MADLFSDLTALLRLVESAADKPYRYEPEQVILPRELAERAVTEGWLHPSQIITSPRLPAQIKQEAPDDLP